tara:strand:+ start:778 stop:2136 length:1359 start_codon:yes stop_codon:yes gene_type:complete
LLETIKKINELTIHKKTFESINNELHSCYRDYANKEKIINLLEFWIFSVRVLYIAYGPEIVKIFLKGNYRDIYIFSISFEFGDVLPKPDVIKINRKSSWLLQLNKYFSIQYRLPAAPQESYWHVKSYKDYLLLRYTSQLLKSISTSFDKELTTNIISAIDQYFSKEKMIIDKNDILLGLPDLFKSKQIHQKNNNQSIIHCSPNELFQFCGKENIFLLNEKIMLYGYQHGGGYDIFETDTGIIFEKKISDKFFGWGLSEKNVKQSRFRKKNRSLFSTNYNKKVVWFESSQEPKFHSFIYPIQYTMKRDKRKINYIYSELQIYGQQYFRKPYPGLMKSEFYVDLKCDIINSKPEEFLFRGDLALFDTCLHSLIFFCIENEILFIIIDDRNIYKHYKKKTKEWINVLRKNNLFFFSDEKNNLANRLNNLNFNFIFPNEVVKYHRNVFQNILTRVF